MREICFYQRRIFDPRKMRVILKCWIFFRRVFSGAESRGLFKCFEVENFVQLLCDQCEFIFIDDNIADCCKRSIRHGSRYYYLHLFYTQITRVFVGCKLYEVVVEFRSNTNWVRIDDVFSWAVTQCRPHTLRGTPLETQLPWNLSSKWWLEKCQFVKSISLIEIMYLSGVE